MMNAFETSNYTNVFKEYGYTDKEIDERLKSIYNTLFFGTEDQRIYHVLDENTACIVDTGNNDARTEGMSYGMMMCVQNDMKKEFDCLWNFAKKYMYINYGENKGYFAWSVQLDGAKNSDGPAPDGEEYFAMALFFASHRWGDGKGIFNYSKEAKELLNTCIHKGENGIGQPMWNNGNKLIKFVPGVEFTDPSYHLPHFYELFSLWSNEEDREFWKEAAENSREYLKKACNNETGLAPEYSYYDGKPFKHDNRERYYSDAYRVAANIGLSHEWFGKGNFETVIADKIQKFFCETVKDQDDLVYEIDGTIINEKAMHPVAIIATNAMASLAASKGENREKCVRKFWNTPLRTGVRRYYDNCLYLFAFLALSGKYKIWK